MTAFRASIETAAHAIEAVGVLVVLTGLAIATWRFLHQHYHRQPGNHAFGYYRRNLGRSIILGLEFLIAGDIIRTVVVTRDLAGVASLAFIILIRSFMSFTLHLEVEGRWPWQPAPDGDRD